MKKIVAFLVATTLSISVFADAIEAPVGLKWGQTQESLKASGTPLIKCGEKANLVFCISKNPPEPSPFGRSYRLIFDKEQGLQKVQLVSTFENDPNGSYGKKVYSEIKKSLFNKYGKPATFERISGKLNKASDEFYQCLKDISCGEWQSHWSSKDGGGIALGIMGDGRERGYLLLTVESKKWGEVETIGNTNNAKAKK